MGCSFCKPSATDPGEAMGTAEQQGNPQGSERVGYPGRTLLVGRAQAAVFQAGEQVEAQYWTGDWHSAIIEKDNGNGMFALMWDDGDPEDRVKDASRIRKTKVVSGAGSSGSLPGASEYYVAAHQLGIYHNPAWVPGATHQPGQIASSNLAHKSTLRVDRGRLLASAIGPVLAAPPELLRPGRLRVQYVGEDGEDGQGGGGVTRAFLTQAGGHISKWRLGLFVPAPGGRVQLNPLPGMLVSSSVAPDDLEGGAPGSVWMQPERWARFLGRLLAMAVAHECPLGLLLVPSLCKQLLGLEPSFDDLRFAPGLGDDTCANSDGCSGGGASWFTSLRALMEPQVAQEASLIGLSSTSSIGSLSSEEVDEALDGLYAVMPSRAAQAFDALANHIGQMGCPPSDEALTYAAAQRWEEYADLALQLLRAASTCQQRKGSREAAKDLLAAAESGMDAMPAGAKRALLALRAALRPELEAANATQVPIDNLLGGIEEVGRAKGKQSDEASSKRPALMRDVSSVCLDGHVTGEALTQANLSAFAEALTKKALTENLQPHLGAMCSEFRQVCPPHLLQALTWHHVQDRISGHLVDSASFVLEWQSRTTYHACHFLHETIRLWWVLILEASTEELRRLFEWCTSYAAMPKTPWKFQIRLLDDTERCPSVNLCMTDDTTAANHGVKMPTLYLPAYSSMAILRRKLDWALASSSEMHLH